MAIKLVDSNIYHSIFGHEQDSKRFYYQSILEERNDVEIYNCCYYKNKLYLHFSVVNYKRMKSAEELELANMEVEIAWDTYLAEFSLNDNELKLLRQFDLVTESGRSSEHFGFSIYKDQPVLYFNDKTDKEDNFSYFYLEKEWFKTPIAILNSKRMSNYFSENNFFNGVIYNYDEFILINNNTGKYRKLFEGKMMESMLLTGGDLYVYNNWVYFNVLHRKSKSHKLIRVSLETSKVEVLQEFTEQEAYSFYPVFYHDDVTQILYVLDINDKKAMYIVGSVKL